MYVEGEYGNLAYTMSSSLLFGGAAKVIDNATIAGKITKTDNVILNIINEMWEKTADFIYNHANKVKEEEKDK